MFDVIAFDADDTLWHNESLYTMTQERFSQLLIAYQDNELVQRELYETEMRNLQLFGYGIKGFTLSMIETAIELTGGQICGEDIQVIIDFAKEMLNAPVRLLDHVVDVLSELSETYQVMLITKGDLFDQETKFARSGLAPHFDIVEIVSEKAPDVYSKLLLKNGLDSRRFLMVGNSMKSDILPVVAIGGQAVYIPYHITWAHEEVGEQEAGTEGFYTLDHIGQLPDLIKRLTAAGE